MKTFRFLDFPVYLQAKKFYKIVITLCDRINKNYSLKDQLSRAALSVILNIAEGSAKKSDREFARFLETSIASMNEVVACLDIMCSLDLISEELNKKLVSESESIIKQLGGFIKKLHSKS